VSVNLSYSCMYSVNVIEFICFHMRIDHYVTEEQYSGWLWARRPGFVSR
jgi:hypothetical protein